MSIPDVSAPAAATILPDLKAWSQPERVSQSPIFRIPLNNRVAQIAGTSGIAKIRILFESAFGRPMSEPMYLGAGQRVACNLDWVSGRGAGPILRSPSSGPARTARKVGSEAGSSEYGNLLLLPVFTHAGTQGTEQETTVALRKTEKIHMNIRPITKMALRRMAEDRGESMTETMEQIVLAKAREEMPGLFDMGDAGQDQ